MSFKFTAQLHVTDKFMEQFTAFERIILDHSVELPIFSTFERVPETGTGGLPRQVITKIPTTTRAFHTRKRFNGSTLTHQVLATISVGETINSDQANAVGMALGSGRRSGSSSLRPAVDHGFAVKLADKLWKKIKDVPVEYRFKALKKNA